MKQTFLVTGANTGIGQATAAALVRKAHRVVVACRSQEKADNTKAELAAAVPEADLDTLVLDLSDFASVRQAAGDFLARGEPLHGLINNAGLAGQRGLTAGGFELAFGVNHLGPFLFTTLLVDRLAESAPSRVVCVSSDSHYSAKGIPWESLRQPTKSITGLPEYAVSKLANVLFAQELDRRAGPRGVSTYSLHPGVIASDIWRRVPGPVRWVMTRFMKSPDDGARTSVYCATEPGLEARSGRYWVDEKEKEPNPVATPELAADLWARSLDWTSGTPG